MSHPNGRGPSPFFGTQGGKNSRDITHCSQGHEFTEENTSWVNRKSQNPEWPSTKRRVCKICARESRRRYRFNQALKKALREQEEESQAK